MQPVTASGPSEPAAATAVDGGTVRSAQVRLIGAVTAALISTAIVLCGVLLLVSRDDWWLGLLAAATASTLAAGASVVPLLWSLRRGLNAVVGAYFVGAGARVAISLGGCLLAIRAGGYPAAATLLLMVPFYFAVLAAETAVVARTIWNAKA